MVNTEDVLHWFGNLDGFKRIDVMFKLLHMCLPFEVRFLGSCIEAIGKHSYQDLHGSAIVANDYDRLCKDTSSTQNILDDGARHRVLIYLSLLSTSNFKCAEWYYKTLLTTNFIKPCVLQRSCEDENFRSEFLLLFTLALHHPAFTFEQRRFFGTMLEFVLNKRECTIQPPDKTFTNYSPSLGYYYVQTMIPPTAEVPTMPPTNSLAISSNEALQQPSTTVSPPVDLIHNWNRPGFPGPISGAPEMPAFPSTSVSPLISQPTSPTHSRPDSPHRSIVYVPNNVSLPPNNQVVEMVYGPQVLVDQPSQTRISCVSSENSLNNASEDKMRDFHCTNVSAVRLSNMKPPNGVRSNCFNKVYSSSISDQLQSLNLDGDYPHRCSSSNSSSNNSVNHSPPNTPPTMPMASHHSPNREDKNRSNSGPIPYVNPSLTTVPPLPLCDTSAPPPPLPATLNNCSVPYPSNYPPPVTLPGINNRSVFNYTQPYRPPFSAPYSYHHSDLIYFPFMVSSAVSQIPPRNCYNCGADGHNGVECTGQTIEEITQKKTYMLDYNLPEFDK